MVVMPAVFMRASQGPLVDTGRWKQSSSHTAVQHHSKHKEGMEPDGCNSQQEGEVGVEPVLLAASLEAPQSPAQSPSSSHPAEDCPGMGHCISASCLLQVIPGAHRYPRALRHPLLPGPVPSGGVNIMGPGLQPAGL